MTHLERIKNNFIRSLSNSQKEDDPYTHWLLSDVFGESDIDDLLNLPFSAPRMDYSVGKRDANNDKRGYFDIERRHEYPICGLISDTLQSSEVTPHTDIGVKKFTMLIYLSRDAEASNWGTTIYKDAETIWGTVPSPSNHALIFIPANNSWHGYEKRPMSGLRKSLIVNYVTDEWRARNELAFPDSPVTSKVD